MATWPYGCSRTGFRPGLGPTKPCANLVPGGVWDLVQEGGVRPCAGEGVRPCARYLREDLVPGTCAVILTDRVAPLCNRVQTNCKKGHIAKRFEARYHQVVQLITTNLLQMENG